MGCNAMHVEDVEDRKYLQYTQYLMLQLEKPWVSAFQNFFRIENPLNIKEVMSKNMFAYILSFFWTFDQLFLFITIFDTFDMKVIT